MIGIRYLKSAPTDYVMQHVGGKLRREGSGLSFFYFAPTSMITRVAMGTRDVPFLFEELTSDFQDVSVQGELTYRITDPKGVSALLDFSLTPQGHYRSDDPGKLDERLVHATQILARSFLQQRRLTAALVSSTELLETIRAGLTASEAVKMLGLEVLNISIIAIRANPEMGKALQAEAREELLKAADEAVYARRNAAIQMERQIKENEFETEIAVESKRRQVRETKMQADVELERQRTELVETTVANERKEAEVRGEALRAVLAPLKDLDWRTLMALGKEGLDSRQLIALAFRDLAERAEQIGSLNITPDLLQSLIGTPEKGRSGRKQAEG